MATKKKAEPKPEAAAPEVKKITGTVFCGGLNVRKEPDLKAAVVDVLKDGTVIEIVEPGDVWHKTQQGYIMSKWVRLD